MSEGSTAVDDPGTALLALYDAALPTVYGYLLRRCSSVALAEDLTAEVFLAAVDGIRSGRPVTLSVAWLLGVARHKLADHWRRQAREDRRLAAVAAVASVASVAGDEPAMTDPWEVHLDVVRARDTLAQLAPHHRGALVLRYLDDLPVSEVAAVLNRTEHSTEGLLVRARAAFRRAYRDSGEGAGDV